MELAKLLLAEHCFSFKGKENCELIRKRNKTLRTPDTVWTRYKQHYKAYNNTASIT